jgi:hypothetical protein
MDVDVVLLSVQERDNWRRRLELLEQTLREIRERRTVMEARMKSLRKDLQKLSKSAGLPAVPPPRPSPQRMVHAQNAQRSRR